MIRPKRAFRVAYLAFLMVSFMSVEVNAGPPRRAARSPRGGSSSSWSFSQKSRARHLVVPEDPSGGDVDLLGRGCGKGRCRRKRKTRRPSVTPEEPTVAPTVSLDDSDSDDVNDNNNDNPTAPAQPTLDPNESQPTTGPTTNEDEDLDDTGTEDSSGSGKDTEQEDLVSTCDKDLPSGVTTVVDQLFVYEYDMHLIPDTTDAETEAGNIEFGCHAPLALHFLECKFRQERDFYVYSITTILSSNEELTACATAAATTGQQEQNNNVETDCYTGKGKFRAQIFYSNNNNRRRSLAETLSDETVVKAFGDFLRELFEGDTLLKDDEEIVDLEFKGFTNRASQETYEGSPVDPESSSRTYSGAQGQQGQQKERFVGPFVAVFVVAVLVLAVVAFVAARRRKRRQQLEMMALESKASSSDRGSTAGRHDRTFLDQDSLSLRDDREYDLNNITVLSDKRGAADTSWNNDITVLSDQRSTSLHSRLGFEIDCPGHLDPDYSFGARNPLTPTFVHTHSPRPPSRVQSWRQQEPNERSYVSPDTVVL